MYTYQVPRYQIVEYWHIEVDWSIPKVENFWYMVRRFLILNTDRERTSKNTGGYVDRLVLEASIRFTSRGWKISGYVAAISLVAAGTTRYGHSTT